MPYYAKGSHPISYVYMTEHVQTGEFYIGSHACSSHRTPETDGYFGSGKWLKQAVKFKPCGTQKDYSKFKKHIIALCESRKSAYAMEDYLLRSMPFNPLCRNRWVDGRYWG